MKINEFINNKNVTGNTTQIQAQIDSMKSNLLLYMDMLVKSGDLDNDTIIGEMFSLQVSTDSEQMKSDAIKNGLSFINSTACETILKSYYNISQSTSLMVQKVDFSSSTNLDNLNDTNASNGIRYSFFNPVTKVKLNSSLCENSTVSISIPIKNSSNLNMSLYSNLSKIGVDIFDANDTAFVSRCISVLDPETNISTSVNYRIENYGQTSAQCSENCTYNGIDENNYVQCDCVGVTESETSNTFDKIELTKFPTMNWGIVVCYNMAFQVKGLN